ncbi:MAG: energy transducer TonB [Prevotellaceae bacterium]|nr:energy transducer TonB [Prevotellaceae bacterium]
MKKTKDRPMKNSDENEVYIIGRDIKDDDGNIFRKYRKTILLVVIVIVAFTLVGLLLFSVTGNKEQTDGTAVSIESTTQTAKETKGKAVHENDMAESVDKEKTEKKTEKAVETTHDFGKDDNNVIEEQKLNTVLVSPDSVVYNVVEVMPEFPGGMNAMMGFFIKNIKYPADAIAEKVEGRVIVRFVIDADGKVCDVEIVKSVSKSIDAEALRVVKAMPTWIPGKINGKAVRVRFTVPVIFKLGM